MIHCCNARINYILFLGIAFLLLLNSCKKDTESVGAGFVGVRNGYKTIFDTTIEINAYTVQMDSVVTSRLSALALGNINDPTFGVSKASIITQFSLPGNGFSWGTSVSKIDSCFLQLRFRTLTTSDGTVYKDYYGDPDAIHTLKVYLLDESITRDSLYYSTRAYKTTGVEMGSFTGKLNFKDSLTVKLGSETLILPPHIRIPMNQTFRDLLFGGEARGEFASQTAFKAAFKGLVIVDETNYAPGQGAIAYVRLNSDVSAVSAYYGDTLLADFPMIGGINGTDASYNRYTHSDVPADLMQTIFKGSHRDTGYVQPLAGTKLRIELPNLLTALNNPKLAINGAELTFKSLTGSSNSTYSLPLVMTLVGSDSVGKNTFLRDQVLELSSYYGGRLSGDRYSFNIVRHLQNLLIEAKEGKNVNYGMHLIVPADNPITAERVIFDTRKNSGNFKLKLTYTVIQ